jgi:hypothetical protein
MLSPHIRESEYIHYGFGVWIMILNNKIFKYYVMGSDPGIEMQSSISPQLNTHVHILSNIGNGAGAIASKMDEIIFSKD